MSGKPKRKNWGGARPGSGKKRQIKTVSEKTKANWIKAAAELSKEKGETVEKKLLSMLWDDETNATAKGMIGKLYNEALITKETAKSVSVTKTNNPVIGLPPIKGEDPALKVVKG